MYLSVHYLALQEKLPPERCRLPFVIWHLSVLLDVRLRNSPQWPCMLTSDADRNSTTCSLFEQSGSQKDQ